MIIYLIATLMSLFFSFLYKKEKTLRYLWAVLTFLPLFLVAAFRKFVGTDYYHYYYDKVPYLLKDGNGLEEIGYTILAKFSVLFLGNYQWLIAFTAFIVCFFTYKSFFQNSKNIQTSIIFWVSFGCFYFSLNAMRQAMAIAIFLFSVKYIEKRESKKFLLCVLFASSIHLSAIIYIPMYFLLTQRISNRVLFSVSAFLYLVWPVVSLIFYQMILGKYAGYFDWGEISGYNWRFLLPLLLLLILELRRPFLMVGQSSLSLKENIFKNLFIFSFWACNLAPTLTGASASRIIHFFLPGAAIYCSFLLERYSLKVKYAFYIGFLGIFFWISDANPGWVLPYRSIFSDVQMNYSTYQLILYEKKGQ